MTVFPANAGAVNIRELSKIRASRGGLTTKLHALVDADGRPVSLRLTGGQVHDACEAEALIEAIPEGATLLGDKGYDSTAVSVGWRPQIRRLRRSVADLAASSRA